MVYYTSMRGPHAFNLSLHSLLVCTLISLYWTLFNANISTDQMLYSDLIAKYWCIKCTMCVDVGVVPHIIRVRISSAYFSCSIFTKVLILISPIHGSVMVKHIEILIIYILYFIRYHIHSHYALLNISKKYLF